MCTAMSAASDLARCPSGCMYGVHVFLRLTPFPAVLLCHGMAEQTRLMDVLSSFFLSLRQAIMLGYNTLRSMLE